MGRGVKAVTALFTVVYNRNAITKKSNNVNETNPVTGRREHKDLDRVVARAKSHQKTPADYYTGDPRWPTLIFLTRELRRRGHRVLLAPVHGCFGTPKLQKMHDDTYGAYNSSTSPKPDFILNWWTFPLQDIGIFTPPYDDDDDESPQKTTKNGLRVVPTLYYEHGFARGDVNVDPGGLLGDSFYVDSLNQRVQGEDYDEDACAKYVKSKLDSGAFSKRPQDNDHIDLPESILGRYAFLPTQHIRDASIEKYSNLTMRFLIQRVIAWGASRQIPIVVKIHPHIEDREVELQRHYVSTYSARYAAETYVSTASIAFLASRANLTVTLNGGTIVDNFWTATPVLTTAYSMFWKTDAVLFPEGDVAENLTAALDQSYGRPWPEERKRRQRQIVCWLAKRSLNVYKTPEENIEVLQYHLDNFLNQEQAMSPGHQTVKPRRLDLGEVTSLSSSSSSSSSKLSKKSKSARASSSSSSSSSS